MYQDHAIRLLEVGRNHKPLCMGVVLTSRSFQCGHAYRCFCSSDRLASLRYAQSKHGEATMYDRACLNLSDDEIARRVARGEPHTVRLKIPRGTTVVNDLLRGKVVFNHSGIDDQVLMKSDGYPTYHLANVVDDHAMKISHVIRGEEWLPSTPKHIILYKALGFRPPEVRGGVAIRSEPFMLTMVLAGVVYSLPTWGCC
jgi:glutamyl/glutaminyl-tRNA synthetase